MKYAIRSVKYFFYFSFWTTVIVLALVATGLASGDINELFEGGYNALWKIAIFFALVAAVYPKVQFISRRMYVNGEMKDHSQAIASYMMDHKNRGRLLYGRSPQGCAQARLRTGIPPQPAGVGLLLSVKHLGSFVQRSVEVLTKVTFYRFA